MTSGSTQNELKHHLGGHLGAFLTECLATVDQDPQHRNLFVLDHRRSPLIRVPPSAIENDWRAASHELVNAVGWADPG